MKQLIDRAYFTASMNCGEMLLRMRALIAKCFPTNNQGDRKDEQ